MDVAGSALLSSAQMGPPLLEACLATILIIDDSESHRRQAVGHVEAAGLFDEILVAKDGLEGMRLLLSEAVDVVLCDLEMPGLNGEKLLRLTEPGQKAENIPFLILTGSTNPDRKARLLESGACDTITKPYHPADLIARLRLHLKITRLQEELRVKNAALSLMSTTDALTGLRTRRYAREFLAVEFMRARRYRSPLVVVMADLDNFKCVNDAFGHPAGDAVLREVARLMMDSTRASDVASRYGGEELELILPQNTLEGAAIVAERWRAAVEAEEIRIPDGRRVSVTLSIGVAALEPAFEKAEEIEAAADAALYVAKSGGRNRVEVHGSI